MPSVQGYGTVESLRDDNQEGAIDARAVGTQPMQNSSAIAGVAASQASDLLKLLSKSKLALSGAALTVAGFFGIFGVVSLTPQRGIISAYVMFFGLTLCGFALGTASETIARYFGFIFRPHGQLAFMLIAGNLAWTIGILGILAAAFTNFVAITSYYNTEGVEAPAIPSFLGGGGRPQVRSSASGMVDTRDDELL